MKREIKELVKRYKIFPSKRLGQNFLINRKIIEKIIRWSELSQKDTVLEIGAGVGNLTSELAKGVKRVIAIEKDKRLIPILKERLGELKNVEIVEGDVLKIDFEKLKINSAYKVVANLPYYITSPILRLFLEKINKKPQFLILMVQKELAQRVCAKAPKMNLLAVSVRVFAKEVKILSLIPKKYFWPKPKVDSAILKISQIEPLISGKERELFFKTLRAGFSHPRKQIINNLAENLKIEKEEIKNLLLENKISPFLRPENLDIKEWFTLARLFLPIQ